MIKCLCCGKEIMSTANEDEKEACWHKKCIKSFFGTSSLPDIDVSDDILDAIVIENISNGYTIPGVQKKLSLHLEGGVRGEKARLTLVNYPTGYILKPQTKE